MTAITFSSPHTIGNGDITNGYFDLHFNSFSAPGGSYYLAIELYSNGNANPIYIRDDYSRKQSDNTSMIYIPGDQIYKDGNALGIDIYNWCLDLLETNRLNFSMNPNPSSGLITIEFEEYETLSVQVRGILGELIYETETSSSIEIELSDYPSGIYFVTASNGEYSTTEKLILE